MGPVGGADKAQAVGAGRAEERGATIAGIGQLLAKLPADTFFARVHDREVPLTDPSVFQALDRGFPSVSIYRDDGKSTKLGWLKSRMSDGDTLIAFQGDDRLKRPTVEQLRGFETQLRGHMQASSLLPP